jgi:demethylmenaquinone methyltransferase/2-methoxy-6-polyprenyl-1,4-benzoquinol methylase
MLAVARQRLAKSTLPSTHSDTDCAAGTTSDDAGPVKFMQGDAMALPFKSDQFDAVTVGYGLRNLADWKVGLGEMVRVAKAGGRILVLDFGRPHNALLRTLYFMYLRFMVPCFGLLFCGNASAYAYILESLHHYPAQDGVAVEMRELGLEQVQIHQLLGGMMSINVGTKTIAKPGTA